MLDQNPSSLNVTDNEVADYMRGAGSLIERARCFVFSNSFGRGTIAHQRVLPFVFKIHTAP